MKKAQGLPLDLLVVGTLAILVLVVVGGAFMAGGSNIFGGIASFYGSQTGGAELNNYRNRCNQECNNLKMTTYDSELAAEEAAKNSLFCSLNWDTTKFSGVKEDYCYGDTITEKIKLTCTISYLSGTLSITSDIFKN